MADETFGTKALLELQVDESSLRSARSEIEERVGSVRANVATDGGRTRSGIGVERRSRENAMTRQLLTAQLERLDSIHDELEKIGPELARSGGGGGVSLLETYGLTKLGGNAAGKLGGLAGLGGLGGLTGLGGAAAAAGLGYGTLRTNDITDSNLGTNLNSWSTMTGSKLGMGINAGVAGLDLGTRAAEGITGQDLPGLETIFESGVRQTEFELENPLDDWQWPEPPLADWTWPSEPSWLNSFSLDAPGWLDSLPGMGNQQSSVLPQETTEGGDVRLRNAARRERGEESIAAEVNIDQTFNFDFSAELDNLQREFDSRVQEIQDAVDGVEDEVTRRIERQILGR